MFFNAFVDYKKRNQKDLVLTDFLSNDELPRVSTYVIHQILKNNPYGTFAKYEGSKIVKLYLNEDRKCILIGVNDPNPKLGIMDIYCMDCDEDLNEFSLDIKLTHQELLTKIFNYMQNN
jgi:hypothetical protein